jgi:hypothetical protein
MFVLWFKMNKEPSEGGPIVSQIRKLILREREEAILFALAQQSRYFTSNTAEIRSLSFANQS